MSDRRVTRCDAGALARPERTQEGFLRVDGVIARACILEYRGADGQPRHELVTPEVLFDAASMRSFSVLALTNNHPLQLLTPESVGAHQIGTVGEPRRVGDQLVSLLGVLRDDAVAAVESGKVALSCGYSCEIVETPGEHPTLRCPRCGTAKYDGQQRDRRGNHVAVVDAARAGGEASIRLDAAGNATLAQPDAPAYVATRQGTAATQQPERPTMPTEIRIDGVKVNSDAPDLQAVIDRAFATIRTDGDAKIAAEKKRADEATAAHADAAKRAVAVRALLADATKAREDAKSRMVECDNCDGSGKVPDPDGDDDAPMVACKDCGGKGEYAAKAKNDTADPIAGVLDAALLVIGGEQDAAKIDAVRADAKVKDDAAVKAAQKFRADSDARRFARNARTRAALLVDAVKHFDAGTKFDGKSDEDVMRGVLAKIAPHLDAAKMDAGDVAKFYHAEKKRADEGSVSPSEALTQSTLPIPGRNGNGNTDALKKYIAAEHAAMNPWALPAGK